MLDVTNEDMSDWLWWHYVIREDDASDSDGSVG
jgi:hypothetical protein